MIKDLGKLYRMLKKTGLARSSWIIPLINITHSKQMAEETEMQLIKSRKEVIKVNYNKDNCQLKGISND